MEEVADDDRQRQAAPAVLAGHLEQLRLGAVAQLALPEPGGPPGQYGGVAGRVGVVAQDVGGLPGGHPVVQLPCAVGDPARSGLGELDPADRRRVPQQAVAPVGQQDGNGHLAVALHQVDHRALLVEHAVGVLTETVDPLPRVGPEALLQTVVAVAGGGVEARAGPPEVVRLLGQQFAAVGGPQEGEPPCGGVQLGIAGVGGVAVDADGDRAVDQGRGGTLDRDDGGPARRALQQRTGEVLEQRAAGGRADPDRVATPRLHPQGLAPGTPLEGAAEVMDVVGHGCSPRSRGSAGKEGAGVRAAPGRCSRARSVPG